MDDEPSCILFCVCQATTLRLKARAQFEMALIDTIVFTVFCGTILALNFTIPALILGYLVSI